MIELSIVISEHNEGKTFVDKMVKQIMALDIPLETIFVTSKTVLEFKCEYGPFPDEIKVIGGVKSTGAAINAGAIAAKGKSILFIDCHVCFTEQSIRALIFTLDEHPEAVVSPGIYPVHFPDCTIAGSVGYGAVFHFDKYPFEWRWLPIQNNTPLCTVPFISGCAFMMRKNTSNHLHEYGGFLSDMTGILWDEEASMRLWRIGHPSYVDPKANMGHMFIGSPSRFDTRSREYCDSTLVKIIGVYINVFDKPLWDYISSKCIAAWGQKVWDHDLAIAKLEYSWIKDKLKPYKSEITESWFFRR